MAPIAAVTGATGFLGRQVVRTLAARGYRVRMLVRRDPTHPQLHGLETEIVPGGLFDPGALDRLVAGAALVVHAAGVVKAARAATFWTANRDGAAQVALAVRRQGAGCRLVLVSSLAARTPALSPYAASKQAGEAAIMATLGPADWVIVRPTAIYGPWDREMLVFFKVASRGFMPLPGRADGRLTLVHVEDAASGIADIATAPPGRIPPGRIYALADGNPQGYGWPDVGRAMAAAVGRPLRPLRIPGGVLRLLAGGAGAAGWVSGRAVAVSPGKIREIMHPDWSIRSDELPPVDGATKVSLEEGFEATVDWYRSAGWLPVALGPPVPI